MSTINNVAAHSNFPNEDLNAMNSPNHNNKFDKFMKESKLNDYQFVVLFSHS